MTDRELMRQAVVALDLAMLHGEYPQDAGIFREISNAANALSARLAQPKPEPVAWTVSNLITDFSRDFSAYQTKTYTRPLYTAPPQREWQGLTDEEIMSLLPGAVRLPPGWSETVRAIEAKLKEKNAA
jgi:hypothetical protein